MAAAILNIVGGLGLFAFLLLMLLRGSWVRQGWNRAPALALMLAALATVMLASSLEQHGARSRQLLVVCSIGYGLSVAALVLWLWGRRRISG